MVYNKLFTSSVGITSFRSTKYKIQNKKGSASFHQVPCGLQPSVTLFSTPITVSRPVSLIKRLHLPLTLNNISKIPSRSECSNVDTLLGPDVMKALNTLGN